MVSFRSADSTFDCCQATMSVVTFLFEVRLQLLWFLRKISGSYSSIDVLISKLFFSQTNLVPSKSLTRTAVGFDEKSHKKLRILQPLW